jgi:hypothetical protein
LLLRAEVQLSRLECAMGYRSEAGNTIRSKLYSNRNKK